MSRVLRAVMSRLRDESGSVLVFVALGMGVVLLLGAVAIDSGNWFTHRRQLQNRADAGALAAGVAYQLNWRACLSGDASVATTVADAARKYAGDPTIAGPLNTEVANQGKILVNINKTGFRSTSPSDGGDSCTNHPANTDPLSPLGGYWTDVKVDESDVPLFFGGFGIAAPEITSQARIELHPILSTSKFSPLAVPVPSIDTAQMVLYSHCASGTSLIGGPYALKKLAAQPIAGLTLWGMPDNAGANQPVTFQLPASGCANGSIGTEVRVAGKPGINLTTVGCTTVQFVSCWTDNGQRWGPRVRVWQSSPDPTFKDVHLFGGTCNPDAYFSTVASCQTGVSVDIDWGTRDDGNKNVSGNFTLSINGVPLSASSATTPSGVWTTNSNITLNAADATPITLTWSWSDTTTGHTWQGNNCGTGNRCRDNGTASLQSAFTATDDNSGIVQLVKLTNSANIDPATASEFDSVPATGSTVQVYLTVGFTTGNTPGTLVKLRSSTSQGNGSINCNNGNQGGPETFAMLTVGCTPYYGVNKFTDPTWWTAGPPAACPVPGAFPANTQNKPWRCGPSAPGLSGTQVADGIAAHTGNCNVNNNGCQGTPTCLHPNLYTPGVIPSSTDPRLITVFLVPYGSFTGQTGSNYSVPIIDFGRFYVTAWSGKNANADTCGTPPGDGLPQTGSGEINGHFVDLVSPSDSDLTATCDPNQLRACLATLTR